MAQIQLHSGTMLNILDPALTDINIWDIAEGLSKSCRYNGQCKDFYSVAQHSVMASYAAPHPQMWGLMHDASEAYISDVVSPLKRNLEEYKYVEEKLMTRIALKFGLPIGFEKTTLVKRIDLQLLATEKRDLMVVNDIPWEVTEGIAPFDKKITPWGWEYARVRFVLRYFYFKNKKGIWALELLSKVAPKLVYSWLQRNYM